MRLVDYIVIFGLIFAVVLSCVGCSNHLSIYRPLEKGTYIQKMEYPANCVGRIIKILGEYAFIDYQCVDYHFNTRYNKSEWDLKRDLEKL